jgi:antitoxin component of MazEF toxin-antitoxin module
MEITKKLTNMGDTVGLIIPKDVCDYLEVDKNSEITMRIEEGKHGKFMAVWKKKVE